MGEERAPPLNKDVQGGCVKELAGAINRVRKAGDRKEVVVVYVERLEQICCMPVDQLQLGRLISDAMSALRAVVKCFDFEIRSLRPLRNRAEY